MPQKKKIPAYGRCPRSGKAFILIDDDEGRKHRYYIGQWGTPRSLELYEETIMINLNRDQLIAAMRVAKEKVAAFLARQPQKV